MVKFTIIELFCKLCHFFVFYRSVSFKNKDDRELKRKNYEKSRKTYFIDFLMLFFFADFFWKIKEMSQKTWVVQKKMLVNRFRYLYHLHSWGFKLKGEQRYLRITFVKLVSWFRTHVVSQTQMVLHLQEPSPWNL